MNHICSFRGLRCYHVGKFQCRKDVSWGSFGYCTYWVCLATADVWNRCKGGRVSDVRTYLKSEDELHPFLTNLWYKLNWGLGGLHDRSGLLQEYKTVTLLLISSCWWRWLNELVKLLCLVTGFTDMTTEEAQKFCDNTGVQFSLWIN